MEPREILEASEPVKIGDGIYKLPLPTPFPVGPVNAYLLEGDPLTLIDTGLKTRLVQAILAKYLKEIGRSPYEIGRIIITHGHLDHYGLAGFIRKETGASISAHEDELAKLALKSWNDERENPDARALMMESGVPPKVFNEMAVGGPLTEGYREALTDVEPIKDGDVIEMGGFKLRVIHTPGHSIGEICLYMEGERLLFSGDHVIRDISPAPILEFTVKKEGERPPSLVNYLNSLEKVRGLDVVAVHSGHGEPVTDLEGWIEGILSHHRKRKEKILGFIWKRDMTPYEICNTLFKKLPMDQVFLGMSEVIGHLEVMEREGLISSYMKGGLRCYHLEKAP